jgi:type 2 lantibiotic biosynthesis protein LanM
MAWNDTDTRRIAARARGLHERLRTPTDDAELLDGDGEEWLARWREHVADDPDAFEGRLEIESEPPETCRRRLHSRRLSDERSVPEWVETVGELLDYVEARDPTDASSPTDADDVPFVDLLAQFVAFASERVEWDRPEASLSERARSDLERWLLDRLSSVAAHALFIEFKTFVASHDRDLALADDPAMPDSPRRYYDRFVAEMHEGGLRSLFEEYATLARLVVTLTDQWRAAVESFGSRLSTDREELTEEFASSESLGRVTRLDPRGDPHRGGQVVFHLAFESGVELAYKPRDLRPEARFADLVSWANAASDRVDLDALDCLVRDGYGWMAWAEPNPCPTDDAVDRYYRRAGSLICLLYALNFTDGHLENVVAAGEYPVVVDLETLLKPTPPRSATPPASQRPERRQNSLLRTDMVPEETPGDVQQVAGFDAASGERTGAQVRTFERVNTDVMDLRYDETATVSGDSLPQFEGEPVDPRERSDALAEGFAETYRFLLDERRALLADDGPLAAFADAELRFVYRPSQAYQTVLTPMRTPECLRDGRTLGCKTERLAEPFATGAVDRRLWPVYEAERTALWRADVPRFSVRADDTTLRHDGAPVADCFDASPLEHARRRIESLSATDCREQLDLLETAYGSRPEAPGSGVAATFGGASVKSNGASAGTDGSFTESNGSSGNSSVAAASDGHDRSEYPTVVFERLRAAATTDRGGNPTWHRCEGEEGVRLAAVGDDFYGGRLGVAAFCAALGTTTGDASHRAFARRVASPVADELDADALAALDVGGATGIGSLTYGFGLLGELLDAEEFEAAARRSAAALTPERFESAGNDVTSGNAGAVLGLLGLYDRTGNDDLLGTATAAGEQLLADRVEIDGVRVWRTAAADRVLTGMAHGVAGIAYALIRLADRTGEERFRTAAREALGYEETAYSAARRNWRDDRPNVESAFTTGWCGGRSGIGLSRLGLYEETGDEAFLADATRALAGTDPDRLDRFDHLCCGNSSRVEFLLRAGRTLDDDRHVDAARTIASATVRRAHEEGRLRVPEGTDNWLDPSLFMGETGVGYTLLRLDAPDLPCVTLWK